MAALGSVPVLAVLGWMTIERTESARGSEAIAPERVTALVEPRPVLSAPKQGWEPRRVIVPALGISAPVVPISTDGARLVPPDDPQTLGWWREGARPGADRGSALVTGHTVRAGGGALDDLERVRPGEAVVVRTDHGAIDYVVSSVRVVDKDVVAERAESMFSQEVDGRLVLLTCEDWDGEGFLSNVVVIAVPA